MNEVFGLPAHPLIVHVPVVLLPLAFLGAILCVAVPRWRPALIHPTVVLGIIGGFGAILATQSGEWLQERVRESAAVEHHQELGEMARNLAILFGASLFVWGLRDLVVLRGRFAGAFLEGLLRPRWIGIAATVAVLGFGTLTTVWVVQAGHSGAKAVWKGRTLTPQGRGG